MNTTWEACPLNELGDFEDEAGDPKNPCGAPTIVIPAVARRRLAVDQLDLIYRR